MYKLFLCLRYLRSRVLAYFAMLGVAMCVAMMLIVISVMNGFLDKIEYAAKGLFGDVIVEAAGEYGLAHYDEFIAELREKAPEVEAASPFILTYGILRVPGQSHYLQPLQVAGIRLPERVLVSDFEEGLFVQQGQAEPTFDPPIDLLIQRIGQDKAVMEKIRLREEAETKPGAGSRHADLLRRIDLALEFHNGALLVLRNAAKYHAETRKALAELRQAKLSGADDEKIERLEEKVEKLIELSGFQPPSNRVILGVGIRGLSSRTIKGETLRYLLPGHRVVLQVFPLGRTNLADISPNNRELTIVDDCRTDVAPIDAKIVYVPFETLQELNNMAAVYADPDKRIDLIEPGRCSQIHIKVKGKKNTERDLEAACGKIQTLWDDFRVRYPRAAGTEVSIQTWRQRQASVVGPIEAQRTLVVTMFGIISIVSVVLIFVIFYMIVVQKTRDIGVLKSVGASSGGVACIFLTYGAAIGLMGAIFGTVAGYLFVLNINPIHDWIGRTFGLVVWRRDIFMFEKIPNQVDPFTAVVVVVSAICAGLLGAILPAIRAGRMQPVEALRYE